jgi:peptide-methionine (S)-S-oxide reductase
MQELAAEFPTGSPIVTEVADAPEFFPAESYHQAYFATNPNQGYCAIVINPKVAAFRREFSTLLKNSDQ